jgi:hypothetical protein
MEAKRNTSIEEFTISTVDKEIFQTTIDKTNFNSSIKIKVQYDDELDVEISPKIMQNASTTWKISRSSLLSMKEEFLNEQFLDWFKQYKANENADEISQTLVSKVMEDTFCFPIFNQHFCQLMLEEVETYLEAAKKEGMGSLPKDFGFGSFIQELAQEYLLPVVKILYPEYSTIDKFQDIYSKIVKYSPGKDEDWPAHVDVSEFTLNICLGREFKGANLLLFGSKKNNKEAYGEDNDNDFKEAEIVEYKHIPGQMIIHRGSNRHSVSYLSQGTRYNIIILFNIPQSK